jgi:hypothetical protein
MTSIVSRTEVCGATKGRASAVSVCTKLSPQPRHGSPAQGPGRYSYYNGAIGDISHHHRTDTHDSVLADAYPLAHAGPSADMAEAPDSDPS